MPSFYRLFFRYQPCVVILVPPRDAALLTDALETYYKEPGLRHQLGQAGRDRVVDDFDLKKNTVELMQHIIKDGRK